MTTEYGEMRYDRPDLPLDCARVARLLNEHGRVSFRYAAFGTLHEFIALDAGMLYGAPDLTQMGNPQEPLWIGPYPPSGVDPAENSHTLWVRMSTGRAAWMNIGGYHDPRYLAEKLVRNETDGVGLAVLFLLIERHRGLDMDPGPVIPAWLEEIREDELPAFIQEGTAA